jgi:hypothetical protein
MNSVSRDCDRRERRAVECFTASRRNSSPARSRSPPSRQRKSGYPQTPAIGVVSRHALLPVNLAVLRRGNSPNIADHVNYHRQSPATAQERRAPVDVPQRAFVTSQCPSKNGKHRGF